MDKPTRPSTIKSISDLVKSNVGTSLIALAVIPGLAILIFLVRSLQRMKRRARRRKSVLEECAPMLASNSYPSHELSEKHETYIPTRPQLVYPSPRSFIDQVERRPTPQYSPISTYSPQTDAFKTTSDLLYSPRSKSRQLYPSPNTTPFISQCPYTPHIHTPTPCLVYPTPMTFHALDAKGKLLRPIPWIHDNHNKNINSMSYPTAPLATRTRSRTLLDEGPTYSSTSIQSNRYFDGDRVDDRYPVALSSSFFSLYSKDSYHEKGCHQYLREGEDETLSTNSDTDESDDEQDGQELHTSTIPSSDILASEPTLDDYYSFSSDEAATSTIVRDILKDDRKNYLPLSSKILRTTTNTPAWTNYDPNASRSRARAPVKKTCNDIGSLLDQFPVVPGTDKTHHPFSVGGRSSGWKGKRRSWDKENVPF